MVESKTFLHVGCGPKSDAIDAGIPYLAQGWKEIRLDINPDVKPDYVGNICDMSAVPSGSVDAVWSSHNIEHVFPHEVPLALAEFHRVLKTDGELIIQCPDIQRVAAFVAAGFLEEPLHISPSGSISAIDMMYGHRALMSAGNLFMAHKTAFTAGTLASGLLQAGFSEVLVIRQTFDMCARGYKRAQLSQPRTQYHVNDIGGPIPKVA